MIRTVFKGDVQDPAKMAHSKMALFQRPCYVRTVNLRAQHEGCQWHYAIILLRRDSAGESGGRAARSSGQPYYGQPEEYFLASGGVDYFLLYINFSGVRCPTDAAPAALVPGTC
jgi:hypothetical protein